MSNEYINSKTKLEYICLKHKDKGSLFIKYEKFKIGQGCMTCRDEFVSERNRFPIDELNKIFSDRNCELVDYSEYKNQKSKLVYVCLNHKDEGAIETTLSHFNTSKYSCKKCYNKSRGYTIEEADEIFKNKGLILLKDNVYKNFKESMRFICPKHKNEGVQEITITNLTRKKRRNGCTYCAEEHKIDSTSKDNHYNWKGGVYDEEKDIFRRSYDVKVWRREVYKRDGYTCQCCGEGRSRLNAHHLDGYSWCKDKRTDVNNGVILCENCHYKGKNSFHSIYGRINNTKDQYIEWLNKYKK